MSTLLAHWAASGQNFKGCGGSPVPLFANHVRAINLMLEAAAATALTGPTTRKVNQSVQENRAAHAVY